MVWGKLFSHYKKTQAQNPVFVLKRLLENITWLYVRVSVEHCDRGEHAWNKIAFILYLFIWHTLLLKWPSCESESSPDSDIHPSKNWPEARARLLKQELQLNIIFQECYKH